jgi:hypothetical protein
VNAYADAEGEVGLELPSPCDQLAESAVLNGETPGPALQVSLVCAVHLDKDLCG